MQQSRISLLALLVALGAAVPAVAQTTTEAPAEGEAAAPAEAPAEGAAEAPAEGAAPDLSMGVDVGAPAGEIKPGDTYVVASFEAWQQRCIKTELSADPCQLYQLLKDKDGNSVAELSFFSLPEGSEGPAVAGATFIAPLETLLTEGLRLTVDSNKTRAYPFTVCTQQGCVARLGFSAEEVAMFKKGNLATMAIVPFVAPDQQVGLEVSLAGFTAGFDAVTAANKLADAAAIEAAKAAPAEGAAPAEAAPAP